MFPRIAHERGPILWPCTSDMVSVMTTNAPTALQKREKKKFSYYSFQRLLSYNAVYNFCVGARGLGKTYGAKQMVIKAFIRDRQEFVWLRRFKTELANRQTFFDDIAHEFPDHGLRVEGFLAQISFNPMAEKPKWFTMGYFVALSTAQTRKGVSYAAVTKIIYDEFIIEKGALHYLPDEATVFTNFYSTVDRWQDKTRAIFLANSVSIMNPYFLEYDIKPQTNKQFIVKGDGFLVAEFADSEKFSSEVKETRLGKFISGSDYESYAVHSTFADAHEYLVARKTSGAEYYATLETKQGIFSVWWDNKVHPSNYYVQEKRPAKERIYVTETEFMQEGKYLVTYTDKFLQYLRAAYGRGNVFFDGPRARNSFAEIFRR